MSLCDPLLRSGRLHTLHIIYRASPGKVDERLKLTANRLCNYGGIRACERNFV
jgi:hypothetical protein